MDQTERMDHFHGRGGSVRIGEFPTHALVGQPDEGGTKTLARGQDGVPDGCGQFRFTTPTLQSPYQEGITCFNMCFEYGRHTAIVGCHA